MDSTTESAKETQGATMVPGEPRTAASPQRESSESGSSKSGSSESETSDLFAVAATDLERLGAGLRDRADAAGLLDVAYRTLETPVGRLLVAATEEGLVRVAYAREDFDVVLAALGANISPRIVEYPARLDRVCFQLDEYFTGARRRFDLALDHRLSSGFRRRVQEQLPGIGYGRTVSYRELAASAGSPRAIRAAGSACATNPLPVVVPCHRVLRSDGTLGGYIGGLDAKTALLDLERSADPGHGTPAADRS